jgi:hypothetical protein
MLLVGVNEKEVGKMIHTYLDQSSLVAMDRMRHEAEFYRLQEMNEAVVQEAKPVRKVTLGQRLRRMFTRIAHEPTDQVQPLPH